MDLIDPIKTLINTTNNNIEQKVKQIENTISDISGLELKKSRLDEEYDIIKIMVEECYQN